MKFFEIISQEQRMKIAEELAKAIQPGLSFYLMTAMSSLIVTYGLLSDSIALIFIGIVLSPLFAAIFAFSLSLIKGDIHLMRRAVHSASTSILLALAVAILLTLVSPVSGVTPSMIERMRPNIFDLMIALVVGVGTGYMLTREGIGPYLPGLAIAILLAPQVSVAGIGLTIRRYDIVGGASLLLLTNLVAIILGNSAIFWVRGFIPYWSSEAHEEIKKKLLVTFVILLILAAPLGYIMFSVINQTALSNRISSVLKQQLGMVKNVQIINYDFDEDNERFVVNVTLRSPKQMDAKMARNIKNVLERHLNKEVSLNLNVVQFQELNSM